MSHEQLPPLAHPEEGFADQAVSDTIQADSDLMMAQHEQELAQIREDEGRKAIEDGVHDIAYTAELHRLVNNPDQLTGEHGLSGYDEVEHRARAAGHQAVEAHRTRVAEIREAADAEYERVRDFERAYEADNWSDVVIALDKMAAYAEKTDDWTEFDKYHDQLRMVERAAYLRHHDAQHPEESTPAPVTPGGGEPAPEAPLVPGAAAAEAAPGDEAEPVSPAPALAESDPEDDGGTEPAAASRTASPWATREATGEEEGEPALRRRPLPSWLTGEGDEAELPTRRVPATEGWSREHPFDGPRGRAAVPAEGALSPDEALPLSPLENTAGVGLPDQRPYQAPVREERPVTFADRWSGTTDAAGRVPGWRIKWRPEWYKKMKANRAAKAELADEERLDGQDRVRAMDQQDENEAADADEMYRRPTPPVVDERDVALRGTVHRVDPRAAAPRPRDRRELRDLLGDIDVE
jgi:hypothetical protein